MSNSICADLCLAVAAAIILAVFVLPSLAGRHLRRASARRKARRQHPASQVPRQRDPDTAQVMSPSERVIFAHIEAHFNDGTSLPSAGGED